MRIGLLSDSHGRVTSTRRGLALLNECNYDLLLHLGDIGSEAVLDELAGMPVRMVFGNVDWDVRGLSRYAEALGLQVDHPIGSLNCDGKTLAYTHGHLKECMKQAIDDEVDYLCHGHTHEVRDERVGSTRVINPGALFRAARYTVALLDTDEDDLTVLEVPA